MEDISFLKTFRLVARTIKIILKRGKVRFFVVNIFFIFNSVSGFIQLIIFSRIITRITNSFIHDGAMVDMHSLYGPLLWLFALSLLPLVISNIQESLNTKIREDLQTDLEIKRIKSFSQLDIATVESSAFQSKLQRASDWGIGAIRNMYGFYQVIIQTFAALIFAGVLLFNVNYVLVIVAIISVLPGYFLDMKFGLQIFQMRYMNTDERRIALNRVSFFLNPKSLIDIIQNKISGRFIKEVNDTFESNTKKLMKIQYKKNAWDSIAAILIALCAIFAMYVSLHAAITGAITIGALLVAFNAYTSFRTSAQGFFENIGIVKDSARYTRDWYELMDMEPKIIEAEKPVFLDPMVVPSIEFKNVSFKYPGQDKYVLQDISFTVSPKTKLAIVGENGAGKTTLIRLITRVYDPTEGEILVNGINLQDISLSVWRDTVAVMLQDFITYNLRVSESITIAHHANMIDQEKIANAAALSGVDDFVGELDKGYDQLIWKGFKDGAELSRGQYQRIAVARTIYRDSSVLVFDEPTSAIDAVAEEKIFTAIETQMQDKSIILISHRFSTVKNADNIIFLEHGKIIEHGSHKELMKLGKRYAELYTMQADRYLEKKKK